MKLYSKVFYALSILALGAHSAEQPDVWQEMSSPITDENVKACLEDYNFKEIRQISVSNIISYLKAKNPKDFELFCKLTYTSLTNKIPEKPEEIEESYKCIDSLLTNKQAAMIAFNKLSKSFYIRDKSGNYIYFYEESEGYNKYNTIFNEYISDIAETEFGRKVLTTLLLCRECWENRPILQIYISENNCAYNSDFGMELKFDLLNAKEKIKYLRGIFISPESRVLESHGFSIAECLEHEFIHLIHNMLKIHLNKNPECRELDKPKYLNHPFLKEVFCNGFDDINTLIYQSIDSSFEPNEFKRIITQVINLGENFQQLSEQNKIKLIRSLIGKENTMSIPLEYILIQMLYLKINLENYEELSDNELKKNFSKIIPYWMISLQFSNEEEINTISGLTIRDDVLYISELHERSPDGYIRFDHTGFFNLDETNRWQDCWRCLKGLGDNEPSFLRKTWNWIWGINNHMADYEKIIDMARMLYDPRLFMLNTPSEKAIDFLKTAHKMQYT